MNDEIPSRKPLKNRRDEIEMSAAALKSSLASGNLSEFYKVFRSTSLPFLCGEFKNDASKLFPACFDVVHRLGSISAAVALAVENHFYVTSAIATFPAESDAVLKKNRDSLLSEIIDGRLLVANSNSKVHTSEIGKIGSQARRTDSGFFIDGTVAYTSLATEADLLVLLTEIKDEGFGLFAIPQMQNHSSLEIGDYLFPTVMIDSDTRKITFKNLYLPEAALVAGAHTKLAQKLIPFEMIWHQLLIPALYLGAAAGAIEEARAFLTNTSGRDGKPLAELDGMIIDVGRLAIEYTASCCVVRKAGDALANIRQLPEDEDKINLAVNLAGAAKYTACQAAESIVTKSRRIVGARSFLSGNPLERLSSEIMFAPLGPEVGAVIERRFGKQALEAKSFLEIIQ